ncbi:MAG TPA: PqqD family peptide modification chaperone [Candidatus Dormibacteraeota bacterium]|nr:PqqD family peptide modification chaperone [Candidatus Dormibacteraeota bacterium]
MIDLADRLELPTDVRFDGDALHDLALGEAYPLRGSGMEGMALLAAGYSIRDAAQTLAARFDVNPQTVQRDLAEFAFQLSRAQLVNLRPSGWRARLRRALQVSLFLVVAHRWPPARVRRYALADGGALTLLRQIASVVGIRMAPLWIALIGTLLLPALLFAPALTPALAAMAVGLVAAVIAHECGHAVAARRAGAGCFLIRSGWRVAVVHHAGPDRGLVHASGPLICGLVGMAGLAAASTIHSLPLAFAALPFVVQLLALTVLAQDGRLLAAAKGGDL